MPELRDRLVALLFVAPGPVTADELARALDVPAEDAESGLRALSDDEAVLGVLAVTRHDGRYRLVTAPVAADDVKRFLEHESKSELSRPALETLSIIAYRGPITRTGVEHIRGVASDGMLRTLLQRGLIRQSGTASEPGRPPLYAVSQRFLEHLGLRSLDELPPLPETGATT